MKLIIIDKVIENLSQGKVFRTTVSVLFRIYGALSIVGGVIIFFWGLVKISDLSSSFWAGVGIFFALLINLIEGWIIFQILGVRSDTIGTIPESDYNVVPIVAVFLKTIGEVVSVYMVLGGIALWLSAGSLSSGNSFSFPFLGGLSFLELIWLIPGAFFVLMLFYFLSECLVAVVDIARNIKEIRNIASQRDNANKIQ